MSNPIEIGKPRGPAPLSDAPLNWNVTKRPVLTTSHLPPDLLVAIRQTARNGKAIELHFDGDAVATRRVVQSLNALGRQQYFGELPIKTARRGDNLYVWLQRRRPPRTKRPARALPPAVTPPMPGAVV